MNKTIFYFLCIVCLVNALPGTVFSQNYWTQTAPYPFDAGAVVPSFIITVTKSGHYLAGTGDGAGIYRSTNQGQTWVQSNGTSWYSHCVSYAISEQGTIFAGMNRLVDAKDSSWILASTNGGVSFTKRSFPNIRIVRLYAGKQGRLFATTDKGIYRSTDDGMSWTKTSNGIPNAVVNDIVDHSSGIYAAVEGEGIFISADGGLNWKDADAGVYMQFTRDLAILPDESIACATQYGAFRTKDGKEWSIYFGNGTDQLPMQTVFGTGTSLYVGLNGSAGYVSNDDGRTWAQLLSGFKSTVVNAFAIDSTGKILAATNTGIFKQTPDQYGLLAMSTSLIEFPETNQGSTVKETVIVSNAGNAALTIKSIQTSGYESSEFRVATPIANKILQPNDTMHLHVIFEPKGSGKRQTDLQFTMENNFSSSDHIILEGLGNAASSVNDDSNEFTHVYAQGNTIIAELNGGKIVGAYSLMGESIEQYKRIQTHSFQWNNLIPGLYFILMENAGNITPYPIIIH
ncbi:MAG: hypothetical protein ACO3YM_07150 [Candidatus Kapaibacteriota bacterium]